ncbi:hypothetical protein J2847_005900 [Azospirillum agricola]|uniref:hypothetical protein n=1 Tax=Azospirillum agricola TaxID=1720247 RepID=UPI001AE93D4B|nr:hypothetical protein [Azospirillum agricola]MBP2232571.1 hypothetical protein [Azospirillum agricola]
MALDPVLRSYVKGAFGNSPGIQAFERSVQLAFAGAEAEIKKLVVAEVHRQLGRAVQESSPSSVAQWIDGVQGAPIESIRFNGVAYFRFGYIGNLVTEAVQLLEGATPVKTGQLVESYIVLVNGEKFSGYGAADYRMIPQDAEIVITNKMYYTGRVEAGKKRTGEPWSAHAPLGVLRPVAEYLRRRWARFATVQYAWSNFSGLEGPSRRPSILIKAKW